MSSQCLISEDFLQRERNKIWGRNWLFAARVDQLLEPGNVLPVNIVGWPILLVKDSEGLLRAFHNVCRHRGVCIVEKPCSSLSALSCPYHGWSYDLTGNLKFRPHFGGIGVHDKPSDKVATDLGLRSVRAEVWGCWIFVDISGQAPPLEEIMAPLTKRLDGYDFEGLIYGETLRFDIQANWKLIKENFIDVMHKFVLHPALEKASPLRTNLPSVWEGLCFIAEHILERPHEGRGKGLPIIQELPERLHQRGIFAYIFPGVCIGIWPDHVVVLEVFPLAPNQTIELIHFYFAEEAMKAEFKSQRATVMKTWNELNNEDISVLESMQRGRNSPGFDGGQFSPAWDKPIIYYNHLINTFMETKELEES